MGMACKCMERRGCYGFSSSPIRDFCFEKRKIWKNRRHLFTIPLFKKGFSRWRSVSATNCIFRSVHHLFSVAHFNFDCRWILSNFILIWGNTIELEWEGFLFVNQNILEWEFIEVYNSVVWLLKSCTLDLLISLWDNKAWWSNGCYFFLFVLLLRKF